MIIQSIFGLFPYKTNMNNDKVQFSFLTWIYSFILHCSISITHLGMIIYLEFQDKFQIVFESTSEASNILQILNLKMVYDVSMVVILSNRRKYAKLLNHLNNVDRKVERFLVQGDKQEKRILYLHFLIYATYLVLNFIVKLELSSPGEFIMSIVFGFEIITLTFISFFIRFIAAILNNRMKAILTFLSRMQSNNLRINKPTISECILIFSDLSLCKELLSTIFGFQLFLIFSFDFITISTYLYRMSRYIAKVLSTTQLSYLIWEILMGILIYLIPHVTREVMLIHEMDKLSQNVSN